MIGFLIVAAIVLVVAYGLVRGTARFVGSIATTPKQYLLAWLMVPPVLLAVVAIAGLLVNVGGWLSSPSWAEVGRGIWCVVFGAICLGVAWLLFRLGQFGDPSTDPTRVPNRVDVVPTQRPPYDWAAEEGADAPERSWRLP